MSAAAITRVYVDMVGDLFHGHVSLLRKARQNGDWLVVGVLSDDTAASYKRRPTMTLAERAAVIESCRYVDEVIDNAPLQVTEGFLAPHGITTVVHGDDFGRCERDGPGIASSHRADAPSALDVEEELCRL